jgi:WD40-like Beta Propeller Repeat
VRRLAVLVVSAAALGLLPAASAGSSSTAPVIAFVSDQSGDYELWTVRLDGTGLHWLTRAKGMDDTPAWSPDGRRIAFIRYRMYWPKLWVMNANGSRPRRLTKGYSKEGTPVWTRDGKHIVYGSIPDPPRAPGGPTFWSMSPNGTHKHPIRPGYGSPPSFSPNGRRATFSADCGGGYGSCIYVSNADGSRRRQISAVGAGGNEQPAWSPDGRLIAWINANELWVMNADGSQPRRLAPGPLPETYDSSPSWAPDGSRIVFATNRSPSGLAVINRDGTGLAPIGVGVFRRGSWPAWQPRPQSRAVSVMSAARPALPMRAARPADDARLSGARWEEDWRVLALDPASQGYAVVTFVAGPVPALWISARSGTKKVAGGSELANGLLPHRGPGVTVANLPDNAPPQANSLSYARGRYTVDLTYTVRGHLTIVPGRAGLTVGPWHLGPERVFPGDYTVPGRMWWSVPVATGTVSGWLESQGQRIVLRGWRVYQDHVWGQFRRSSTTWTHWDFVLKTPRPGEAWILNGLEPKYDIYPHDNRWQGVLIHATPRGVSACQARITRRAWIDGFTSNTPWYMPTIVRAGCGRLALSAKAPRPWLVGGFLGGVGGSAALPGGAGWIEHGVPQMPNT